MYAAQERECCCKYYRPIDILPTLPIITVVYGHISRNPNYICVNKGTLLCVNKGIYTTVCLNKGDTLTFLLVAVDGNTEH